MLTKVGTNAMPCYKRHRRHISFLFALICVSFALAATLPVRADGDPPDTPANVKAVTAGKNVTLTWSAAANASGYKVYGGADEASLTLLGSTTTTSFSNVGDPGEEKYYNVAATNSAGDSAPSDDIAVPIPPGPASNLTGIAEYRAVKLHWTNGEGSVTETVKRLNDTGGYDYVAVVADTEYEDSGLTNGVKYTYVVTSGAIGVAGADSNAVTISPIYTTPAPVLKLYSNNGCVQLNWTPVKGASDYTVCRGTTKGGPYNAAMTTTTDISFLDTQVDNESVYYYVIEPNSSMGHGLFSNECMATPSKDPTKLGPPTVTPVITPSGGAIAAGATVSIVAAAHADIYYTTDGSLPAIAMSKDYSGPIPITPPETIKAIAFVDGYGQSALASATFRAAPSVAAPPGPPPPAKLVVYPGTAMAALYWLASNGAASYEIFRTPSGQDDRRLVGTVTAESAATSTVGRCSYTDMPVPPGSWIYEITAVGPPVPGWKPPYNPIVAAAAGNPNVTMPTGPVSLPRVASAETVAAAK